MHPEDHLPLTDEERALADRGAELIATAVSDTSAPQSLRESIESERQRLQMRERRPFWRRHALAFGGLATLAVAAVGAIAVLSGGGEAEEPTLAAVQAAALEQPTDPAPALAGGDPPVLAANVGELQFPDWQESFGWRAVGAREDDLEGRAVTSVFYRNPDGAELGYSVVDGEPISDDAAFGREVVRGDNSYAVIRRGDHTLVSWTQQGHTCVIAAPATVPEDTLVELADSRNT